jgi:hypothetical protein
MLMRMAGFVLLAEIFSVLIFGQRPALKNPLCEGGLLGGKTTTED